MENKLQDKIIGVTTVFNTLKLLGELNKNAMITKQAFRYEEEDYQILKAIYKTTPKLRCSFDKWLTTIEKQSIKNEMTPIQVAVRIKKEIQNK